MTDSRLRNRRNRVGGCPCRLCKPDPEGDPLLSHVVIEETRALIPARLIRAVPLAAIAGMLVLATAACGGARVDSGGLSSGDRGAAQAALDALHGSNIPLQLVAISQSVQEAPAACRVHLVSEQPRTFHVYLLLDTVARRRGLHVVYRRTLTEALRRSVPSRLGPSCAAGRPAERFLSLVGGPGMMYGTGVHLRDLELPGRPSEQA